MAKSKRDPMWETKFREKTHEEAVAENLRLALDDHGRRSAIIRKKADLQPTDLLTANILAGKTNLQRKTAEELLRFRAVARQVIHNAALMIDERQYEQLEQSITTRRQKVGFQIQKVRRLLQADRQFRVSCRSVELTVNAFANLNNKLYDEIRLAGEDAPEHLILGHYISVVELCDFLINYIDNLKVNGIKELIDLQEEIEQHLDRLNARIDARWQKAIDEGVPRKVLEKMKPIIRAQKQSIQVSKQEWTRYREEQAAFMQSIESLKEQRKEIQFIRDVTYDNIETYAAGSLMSAIQQSTRALGSAIETLQNLRIMPLDSSRIQRLLDHDRDNSRQNRIGDGAMDEDLINEDILA